MYGKHTLAHTGLTMAGFTVAGMTVPWLALAAAVAVVGGALFLRLGHKMRATR